MTDIEIKEKISKININQLYETFKQIPFGNSDFQDKYFIVNSQLTPARAFRAVCLQLRDRIQALHETYYNLQKENIDIEELQEKLEKEENKYEKRRIGLEIEKKIFERIDTEKLVEDALHEVEYLMKLYNELPHPTREEFEAEEQEHFEKYSKNGMLPEALQNLLSIGRQIDENGNILPAAEDWKIDVFKKELTNANP